METIFLVGFEGVGKTMIGRLLANRKNLKFIDMDDCILEEIKSHPLISPLISNEEKQKLESEDKNKSFLDLMNYIEYNDLVNMEIRALDKKVEQGSIVALSSYAITDFEARRKIKHMGKSIFLKGNVDTIYNNLKKEFVERPRLKYSFNKDTLSQKIKEMTPYYEDVAFKTIVVDGLTVDNVFTMVLAIFNSLSKLRCHIVVR